MDRRMDSSDKEPATRTLGNVDTKEPDFPELTRLRDFDRQMHVQKSLEAGLSREEAEAHADHDLQSRDARDDARP